MDTARFLNVDLEILGLRTSRKLVGEIERFAHPLFAGRVGSRYLRSYELNTQPKTARAGFRSFAMHLSRLSAEALRELRRCRVTLDAGFECSADARCDVRVDSETLARLAVLGIGLATTTYVRPGPP